LNSDSPVTDNRKNEPMAASGMENSSTKGVTKDSKMAARII